MICEGFEQRLAYRLPAQAEASVFSCIVPIRFHNSCEDAVASFRECRIRVVDVSVKCGACGSQDEQPIDACRYFPCLASAGHSGSAPLAAAGHERGRVQPGFSRDARPKMLRDVDPDCRDLLVVGEKMRCQA